MKNEPDKWNEQTWVLGNEPPQLQRIGNHWYVRFLGGARIEIDEPFALRILERVLASEDQAQSSEGD